MKGVVIERDRRELVSKARALATTIGDGEPTDEQRSQADELKTKIEQADADLKRAAYFDELVKQTDEVEAAGKKKPADKVEAEFETRCRDFSIRAAVADALGMKSSRDLGPEREVSQEIVKRSGRDYEGIAAPMEALQVRAVTTTTPGAGPGSRIVPTDYRPGDYIDLLRDALVTRTLGIRVLRGLSGNASIPKAQAGATAGWATENGAFAEQDLQFEAPIAMTPHKVGAWGQWSSRMMLQASPDVEMLFRRDFAASLANAIDVAVLGDGAGQAPNGVLANTTRTARRTADPVNGVALNAAEIYGLMLSVDEANIGQGQRALLFAHALQYHAAQQVLFAGTDRTWYENGQLLGTRSVVSEIAPVATRGSLANGPTLIYGNWSDVILGYWQDLDILVNPYESAAYKAGAVMIRIMAHADIAFRHDEAFQYLDGIIIA